MVQITTQTILWYNRTSNNTVYKHPKSITDVSLQMELLLKSFNETTYQMKIVVRVVRVGTRRPPREAAGQPGVARRRQLI